MMDDSLRYVKIMVKPDNLLLYSHSYNSETNTQVLFPPEFKL